MRTLLIPLALVALALGACGKSSSSQNTPPNPNVQEQSSPGDIPDDQAYVRYTPRGANFSVKVPEGWARSTSRGAVTFTDKLNSIRIEEANAPAAPTVRDARQTEVPKLAKSVKGFRPETVTRVSRRAGQAIRITYLADTPPNEVTGKAGANTVERYVFFHNDRDVVLTLAGPKGADNVDPWKIVTDSVRWTA